MTDIKREMEVPQGNVEDIYIGEENEEDEVALENEIPESPLLPRTEEIIINEGETYTNQTNESPDINIQSKKKKKSSSASFSCLFMKRIFVIFFCKLGLCSFLQIGLFIAIFVVAILNAGFGYCQMRLYTLILAAISSQKFTTAWSYILLRVIVSLFGTVCSMLLLNGALDYLLFYLWRKELTKNLLKRYFKKKNYYVILHQCENSIDNPDQRIQSDTRDFCQNLSGLVCAVINHAALLGVNLAFLISTKAYWLFIPVVLFPVVSSIGYLCFFTPVSRNIFEKDSLEGDFRYAHARIRENAESISFFKSEKREETHIRSIFKKLKKVLQKLALKMFLLGFWQRLGIFVPTITYIFTLVLMSFGNVQPYYEGMDDEGIVKTTIDAYQAANGLSMTLNAILSLGQFLGVVIGNTARISEMFEMMSKIEKEEKRQKKIHNAVREDHSSVTFQDVVVQTPEHKKELFQKLSFCVRQGEHMIIMGPSGVGKSSILRVLCGLWNCEQGLIYKPNRIGENGIFFLPQKPYILNKTLKENISYPLTLDEIGPTTDEEFYSVLDLANVAHILKIGGLSENDINWNDKLSQGEKQRLTIARMLFNRPKFCILDEATSALDPENEDIVYTNIQKCGITCISVAHRMSVQKYHDYCLKIVDDKGNYEVIEIDKTQIPTYQYDWKILGSHEPPEDISNLVQCYGLDSKDNVENSDKNLGSTGFNFTLLKRMCRLCCCGWMIRPCSMWIFVIGTLMFIGVISMAPMLLFQGSGAILTAMVEKDLFRSIFMSLVIIFGFCAAAFGSGVALYCAMCEGICCRVNLTHQVQERYFRNQMYYEVNVIDKSVENVDQRITNDIDLLTSGFEWNQGLAFLGLLVPLSFFSIISVLIMATLLVSYWLAIYGIVSFIFIGIVQMVFMVMIGRLRFLMQKREGYFRFSLTKMKESSEQIAFYNGSKIEQEIILKKFKSVMNSQFWLFFVKVLNDGFVECIYIYNGFMTFTIILFSIYAGYLNLEGMTSGQILGTVQSLTNMLESVIASFLGACAGMMTLGQTIGTIGRVGELIEKFDQLEKKKREIAKKNHIGTSKSKRIEVQDFIGIEKLTGETPTKRILFHNLSFTVKAGDRTLIRGPSGCGKSSLLRIISGLWNIRAERNRQCKIYCPTKIGQEGIYFLPQQAYICPGSLLQQIIYPDEKLREGMSTRDLTDILEEVNLYYILDRVGGWYSEKKEWSSVLSPGECQRIGSARLLYHKPKFVILDECSSSLDVENENMVYEVCEKYGITPLSVGHRLTLLEKHSHVLEFSGSGGWVWKRKDHDENLGEMRYIPRSSVKEQIKRSSLEYRKSLKSRSIDYMKKIKEFDNYRTSLGRGVRIPLDKLKSDKDEVSIEIIGEVEEVELMENNSSVSDVLYSPSPSLDNFRY